MNITLPSPELKRLTIDQLVLRHFRGTTELTVDLYGNDLTVYGDNGTGKTTLADSWFWLITNKDSLGRAEFDIKTKSSDGATLRGLGHFAAAVCHLDGAKIEFNKTYQEVWTEKRGSHVSEMTSNSTQHQWQTVNLNKGDYEAKLKDICDPEIMRQLMDPHYVSSDRPGKWIWKNRRELLLEVCGNVSIADVIAANPEFSGLPELLGVLTVDEKKKQISDLQKGVNDELKLIPTQIQEAERAKPVVEASDPIDVPALKNALEVARRKKASLETGGAIADKRRRIAEIDAAILAIQTQLRSAATSGIDAINAQIRGKANLASECETKIDKLNRQVLEARSLIKAKEERREVLLAEWNAIQAEEFTWADTEKPEQFETVCSSCGQEIPAHQLNAWLRGAEERIGARRQAALESFNSSRANRLEANQTEGKNGAAYIKEMLEKIELAEKEIEVQTLAMQGASAERAALETQRDGTTVAEVDLSADPKAKELIAEKETLTSEIQQLQEGNTGEIREVEEEIRKIETSISFAEKQQTQQDNRDRQEARIKQLQDRQKDLSAQHEELQKNLVLIERFTVKKIEMLDEKINSKFKLTKFKLFNQQVNGGIEECCEATYQGVPYSSLNHGSKINVGLDIINTLAEHYGFAPPIFIDNAESVTSLIRTHGQQIRLVVSAADKVLRFEATATKEAA